MNARPRVLPLNNVPRLRKIVNKICNIFTRPNMWNSGDKVISWLKVRINCFHNWFMSSDLKLKKMLFYFCFNSIIFSNSLSFNYSSVFEFLPLNIRIVKESWIPFCLVNLTKEAHTYPGSCVFLNRKTSYSTLNIAKLYSGGLCQIIYSFLIKL